MRNINPGESFYSLQIVNSVTQKRSGYEEVLTYLNAEWHEIFPAVITECSTHRVQISPGGLNLCAGRDGLERPRLTSSASQGARR